MPAVCPGVCSGRTSSAPNVSVWPASIVPVTARATAPAASVEQLALERADQDLELRPALAQRAHLADVVEVVVGEQHVRGRQPQALGRLDQRLTGPPASTKNAGATLAVGDEIGVRQELRMGRALDDHRRHLCTKTAAQRSPRRSHAVTAALAQRMPAALTGLRSRLARAARRWPEDSRSTSLLKPFR